MDTANPVTRDIVTIGASAGGVSALLALCSALPKDIPASVLVVQHIGNNTSVLPMLLSSHGNNPAVHPTDGERLEKGKIYVAPPDHHMLVEDGVVRLTRTAKEHHTRPAIDPLFRTAAYTYGPRVIGVVLTGRLDDGTSGLQAVKECGGLAIVQDPADAEHPSMPRSALRSVKVDRTAPLGELGKAIMELLREPIPTAARSGARGGAERERLERELMVSAGEGNAMENLNAIGKPSSFACPDCAGVLWEIGDTVPPRYRCHTGHAFSLRSLESTQRVSTEDAIWSATRALQMREELLRRVAEESRLAGAEAEAERESGAADEAARHAQLLLQLLNSS